MTMKNRLAHLSGQLAWEIPRAARFFVRRFGTAGVIAILLAATAVAAALAGHWQSGQLEQLRARIAESELHGTRQKPAERIVPLSATGNTGGRARLRAFEMHLLPHEDIPVVLQDMLRLAEEQGIVMKRGEYRPELDQAGGFLRYRMDLPLQGPAPDVYRFIQRALLEQGALALRSVRFNRAHADAEELEARMHWVVLTRMPEAGFRAAVNVSGEDR